LLKHWRSALHKTKLVILIFAILEILYHGVWLALGSLMTAMHNIQTGQFRSTDFIFTFFLGLVLLIPVFGAILSLGMREMGRKCLVIGAPIAAISRGSMMILAFFMGLDLLIIPLIVEVAWCFWIYRFFSRPHVREQFH